GGRSHSFYLFVLAPTPKTVNQRMMKRSRGLFFVLSVYFVVNNPLLKHFYLTKHSYKLARFYLTEI
ncbi:MAG: hypothetical protein Q8Q50_08610, partial [Methylobacter sp.]|nr:hypothetical protein [Methylobacter sp.]